MKKLLLTLISAFAILPASAGTNAAITLNTNTLSLNLSGQISGSITDLRPGTNYNLDGASVSSGIPCVLATNAGEGTCTTITLSYGASTTNTNSPALTIIEDGLTNTCEAWSWIGAQGWPTVYPSGGSKWCSYFTIGGGNQQVSGGSVCCINWRTNFIVKFTAPFNCTLYSAAYCQIGAPVTPDYWMMKEYQTNMSSGVLFTNLNLTGHAGMIESWYMFGLGAAGTGCYIESVPGFQIDNGTFPLAPGLEDVFLHGTWDWDNERAVFATPEVGTYCTPFMANLYGFGGGNSSYRFFGKGGFPNIVFTNAITNVFDATGCVGGMTNLMLYTLRLTK
jgi:hypothetical protein